MVLWCCEIQFCGQEVCFVISTERSSSLWRRTTRHAGTQLHSNSPNHIFTESYIHALAL